MRAEKWIPCTKYRALEAECRIPDIDYANVGSYDQVSMLPELCHITSSAAAQRLAATAGMWRYVYIP